MNADADDEDDALAVASTLKLRVDPAPAAVAELPEAATRPAVTDTNDSDNGNNRRTAKDRNILLDVRSYCVIVVCYPQSLQYNFY